MGTRAESFKGYRYPGEIIAHCVWLYHRFTLSFREVELLMSARGIVVSYETVRQWCAKFGPTFAAGLRRRQPCPGDKWHEVELLMSARGIIVSYETIRQWCAKFGPTFAAGLRRRQVRPGDKWHLDEMVVTINGQQRYLWRAVDQHGQVLDILVQNRRDGAAAKRFLRKLLTHYGKPRVLVTDKLRSYQVAHRELASSVEHRKSKF